MSTATHSDKIQNLLSAGIVSAPMLEPVIQPGAFERILRRDPLQAMHMVLGLMAAGELPSVDVLARSGVVQRVHQSLDPAERERIDDISGALVRMNALLGAKSNNDVVESLSVDWIKAFRTTQHVLNESLAPVTSRMMDVSDTVIRRALRNLVAAGADPYAVVVPTGMVKTNHHSKVYRHITAAGKIAKERPELLDALYPQPLKFMPTAAILVEETGQHHHRYENGYPVSLAEFILDHLPIVPDNFTDHIAKVRPLIERLDGRSPAIRESIGEVIDRMMGGNAFHNSPALRLATLTFLPLAKFDEENSFALIGYGGENVMQIAARRAQHLDFPAILHNMAHLLPRLNTPTTGSGSESSINMDLLSQTIGMHDLRAFELLLDAGLSMDDNEGLPKKTLDSSSSVISEKFSALLSARSAKKVIDDAQVSSSGLRPL